MRYGRFDLENFGSDAVIHEKSPVGCDGEGYTQLVTSSHKNHGGKIQTKAITTSAKASQSNSFTEFFDIVTLLKIHCDRLVLFL